MAPNAMVPIWSADVTGLFLLGFGHSTAWTSATRPRCQKQNAMCSSSKPNKMEWRVFVPFVSSVHVYLWFMCVCFPRRESAGGSPGRLLVPLQGSRRQSRWPWRTSRPGGLYPSRDGSGGTSPGPRFCSPSIFIPDLSRPQGSKTDNKHYVLRNAIGGGGLDPPSDPREDLALPPS